MKGKFFLSHFMGLRLSDLGEHGVPIFMNVLLFVVVTIFAWNRLLSTLFERDINRMIREKKECIKAASYLSGPFSATGDIIANEIDYIQRPTIGCNWKIYQKLGFITVVLIGFLALSLTIATPETRQKLLPYFLLATMAYLIDLVFLVIVVVPYKHISFVETVHRVTDI